MEIPVIIKQIPPAAHWLVVTKEKNLELYMC